MSIIMCKGSLHSFYSALRLCPFASLRSFLPCVFAPLRLCVLFLLCVFAFLFLLCVFAFLFFFAPLRSCFSLRLCTVSVLLCVFAPLRLCVPFFIASLPLCVSAFLFLLCVLAFLSSLRLCVPFLLCAFALNLTKNDHLPP